MKNPSDTDRAALPVPAPPSRLLDLHRDTIRRYKCHAHSDPKPPPLVPLDAIAELRRELTAKAPVDEVAAGVKQLMGSFVKGGNGAIDPAQFAEAMTEELAAYPLDVLRASAVKARRTIEWLPSIAEMIRLCESEMEPRRDLLRVLADMEREHLSLLRPSSPPAHKVRPRIAPPSRRDDDIPF